MPKRGLGILAIGFLLACGGSRAGSPAVVYHASKAVVPLDDLRGKVVVLNYWATWCMPCMREIPTLVRLAQEKQGAVVFVALNEMNDEDRGRERVAHWLTKNPAGFTPYIAYGNDPLFDQYRARVYPMTYVLDRNGQLVGQLRGTIDEDEARALLDKALAVPEAPRPTVGVREPVR